MNTVRPFLKVLPDEGHQLLASDLSCVSSSHLAALSNTLYKELDTIAPDPRTRDRYDALIQEIESRSGPFTLRSNDAPRS